MIVLMIIAILLTLALPDLTKKQAREQVMAALEYSDNFKGDITAFYSLTYRFPVDNEELKLPEPGQLINTLIEETSIEDGAIQITFGNKATHSLQGKILSIRPITVDDSPRSPVDWICGYAKPVKGTTANGENKTSVEQKNLPTPCLI